VLVHRSRAVLHDIFGSFLRASQCRRPAGNDALDHRRIGAERRWTLACIQNSEASGSAGSDVEEAAAGAERSFGEFHCAGDLFALRCDSIGNTAVFSVYEVYDLER